MALGYCTADSHGVESDALEAHGVTGLHSTHRVYGGDAAATFLDGGDSWLPAAEKFRTGFLLFVSGAVLFLWRVAAGAELADLLPASAGGAQLICHRNHLVGTLHVARAAAASAHGICRDARTAQDQEMETRGVISFLWCLSASCLHADSVSSKG